MPMHGLDVISDAIAGRLRWDDAAIHLASPEAWRPCGGQWAGRPMEHGDVRHPARGDVRHPAHTDHRHQSDVRHPARGDVRHPAHSDVRHPAHSDVRPHGMQRWLRLRALDVAAPGGERQWRLLYHEVWPAYRAWFCRPGGQTRPSLDEARHRLRVHMPELVPTWERLTHLAGRDETTARMLAMYNPPPFLSGCSQAALGTLRPGLVRNYDYDEQLFEGVVMGSRFGGHRVVGTSDQLWGLLDGMNDEGLAISLAFGGRRAVGDGFGIPIVLRYVLETCATLVEARACLARLPVQMSYNVLVVDREGRALTAFVNPDRAAEFSDAPATTNHQGRVEWPEHDRLTGSVARAARLRALLAARPDHPDGVVAAFLRPPLRSTNYRLGTGTLYTAHYQPERARVTYHWPGSSWSHSLDDLVDGTHVATLTDGRDGEGSGT